ncbi:MAG: hypothetical protein HZB31_09650 [Nitrospirae bacterium]|nr:hypothetical protein [Nitrospirota bacterium]
MRLQTILTIVLALILIPSGFAFSQPRGTDETCDTLKAAIKNGVEPRSALRDVLKTKPEVCPIIRCALETGIPLRTVHLAARDAALQDDIVTRCSNSSCSQTFRLFETDQVCRSIKQDVEKGRDAAVVTLEKLRQGYQSCTVLKCAVASGADLDSVIRAAHEANVSDDIISRCCMDGCADPYRVARLLHEQDNLIPADRTKPGGTRSGYLSPSRF